MRWRASKSGLELNGVSHRAPSWKGTTEAVAPRGVADRVLWAYSYERRELGGCCGGLKVHQGGTLHVHENVNDDSLGTWVEYLRSRVVFICGMRKGGTGMLRSGTLRRSSDAPHVMHVVADAKCVASAYP